MKTFLIGTTLLTAAFFLPLRGTEVIDLTKGGFRRFPLPEKYAKSPVTDITPFDFSGLKQIAPFGATLADDSDALGGKALCLGEKQDHRQNFSMGIQGRTGKKSLASRRLPKNKIPQDEKYHLYSLGQVTLEPSVIFWGHRSWALQQDLSRFFSKTDPGRNTVEVVVSLKFTGPAYVKGSTQKDSVRLDRILLVGKSE